MTTEEDIFHQSILYLLITFANSLDPDQGRQNDDTIPFVTGILKVFLQKIDFEKYQQTTKKSQYTKKHFYWHF